MRTLLQIIVEPRAKSKVERMKSSKFLVPHEMTVGQLHQLLSKTQLDSKEGFWFLVDNVIPPVSCTLGSLYEQHHDDDLFLYISYSDESVFG